MLPVPDRRPRRSGLTIADSARRTILGLSTFWVLVLALPASYPAASANALAGNPSPYLAMHGQDPVDWREWGRAALGEARAGNKLLFISSGYFACHWCHVMQRESYRDPVIADTLNRHLSRIAPTDVKGEPA